MTLTLPRRRFFVTAGLGAAGALTVPAAFVSAQAPTRDAAVMHHVGKELARLYKLRRRQNLQPEHFQTIAGNLRLLAMVFPDVRAEARKPKRRSHDHGMRARQIEEVRKHLGIDISNEPEPAPLSDAEESRLRAQLAAEGLGPTLLRMADAAEARADQMARAGGGIPFRNVQSNPWCTLVPAVRVANIVVCGTIFSGTGLPGTVACYVSQLVYLIWDWSC